ncbi:hypothetical protein PILCRDRAFT_87337 [Piloderma croceum F 1598]|uniref:Uncharacterized protein n=1 Tax=Piloderma croceum (strain F 1598) TaxID=765440 RepID=A0A0C3G323_PILCF|nr:hypothetical protein PILCRDRAFT_87337 [Piloderma croceum F 1598]
MPATNRTLTPTRGPTQATLSTSENEVENTLTTNGTHPDTEMLDGRGKNPLSRTRGDSTGDTSQPPRKKTSPNTPPNNPLPTFNRITNHDRRLPPLTGNQTPASEHQTPQPQQPAQTPPPIPNEEPPIQPQEVPHHQAPQQTTASQQQVQPQVPEPQQPLPGFTSAEEREEMRRFAAERTQTLARQAAARSPANSNELEITPSPEQGFYCPEGLLGRWAIDNVKTTQVTTITSQPGASVVVHIEGETSHDPNRAPHLAAGLARELKRILPLENPQVVPGIPATPPAKATDAPYAYFVHGLTSNAYVKLTSQGAWRTRSIAQLSFLGYIQGMSNLTAPHAMTEILDFILNTFRTGEMATAIRTIVSKGQITDQAGDEVIVGQEEVDEIINKLYVERVDLAKGPNIPQPSINLYLMGVDYTDDEWRILRKAASKTIYFPGWICALCHSVTHPTGMCPYLQIEDDVPMSDPIIQPHAKARQHTNDWRGGSSRGQNHAGNRSSRGRGGGSYGRR